MLRCGKGPQDYRIITGRSRDSMMVLVTNMARAALIVAVATSMGMFGRDLHEFLTEDVKGLITHVVTGKDQKPEEQIDKSLAWMQVALSSIDGIKILMTLDCRKTRPGPCSSRAPWVASWHIRR
ncbi:hypothetical protein [Stenotrophomonas sp. SMYL20]|uniref:hypothetical protein n=2 Tax=Stenotrophomonas TaxID=40323 RepID=UPI002E7AAC11|nr:hypothetical protein [Stenotrophomonas sp. SMYL20]